MHSCTHQITKLDRTRQIGKSANYNVRVAEDRNRRVLRAETIGLIVIAILLAIMIVLRWGRIIPWSAR